MSQAIDFTDIRQAVRDLCLQFPDEYHRRIDAEKTYPEAFVNALTQAGWMAALIPSQYGGSGLGLAEASVIMEEINRSGGNAGACHGQMYNMNTLLRHGSEAQKQQYLPKIASGQWRLQSMAVTEPTAGTDTTQLKTTATLHGDHYKVNGQKVWISRVQHSDFMILLARTTPQSEVRKKTEGLSIFIVDIAQAVQKGMTVRPIANMVNHETNELFFDNLEIPAENLLGPLNGGWGVLQTVVTHFAGRRLAGLTVVQQTCEADFRFALGRVRDAAEQIALYRGQAVEQTRLHGDVGQLGDREGVLLGRRRRCRGRTGRATTSNAPSATLDLRVWVEAPPNSSAVTTSFVTVFTTSGPVTNM